MWKAFFRSSRPVASTATSIESRQPENRAAAGESIESASQIARTIREALASAATPDHVTATIRQLVETQYRDEPEFMAELIAGFQRSVPVCLRTIHAQVAGRDFDGMARTARSLKSTSRMIGLDRISGLCKALETISASSPSPDAARTLLDAISAAYRDIRPLLDSERVRIVHEAALRH